jgi:hypothetical protein
VVEFKPRDNFSPICPYCIITMDRWPRPKHGFAGTGAELR